MGVSIRQLRHFVAIVREGGYCNAAQVLSVGQPALSNSIKTLEKHLGVCLFSRDFRGTVLTGDGKIFYRHAVDVLSVIAKMEDEFSKPLSSSGNLSTTEAPLCA